MKILFILKKRYYHATNINSYGLINSATEIANFLETLPGINTKVVKVVDGNSIDKEVHDYRPDIVIIEALWVTGDKLKELITNFDYEQRNKIPDLSNFDPCI